MDRAKSYFFAGLLTGLLAACLLGAMVVRPRLGGGGAVTVLKLAHGLDATHPVHKGMVYMKERLEALTGGSVRVDIYAGGVLGNEVDCLEQVQKGELDMTKVSTAALEAFLPEMKVFGIPFAFRDSEHFWNTLHSPIGKRMLEAGRSQNFLGLCYYDSGDRNFYSTHKPIRTVEDVAGMKVRVMNSRTAMDMIRAMGGSPTPISWGELYTALAQGTVDAAENNPPSFITSRHHEVCRYFTLTAHQRIPDMLIINTGTWERLSPGTQQAMRQAAQESETFQRRLWTEMTETSLAQAREHGVEIIVPEIEGFRKATASMIEAPEYEVIRALFAEIQEVR